MPLVDFISADGQRRIAQAITHAERHTSGEICIHATPHCQGDVIEQARAVFDRLQLHRTRQRNATLIYIAYDDRRVAILGDEGIDQRVPEHFWDDALAILTQHLTNNDPVQGLCQTVALIGDKLREYFPANRDDINELSNEITFED